MDAKHTYPDWAEVIELEPDEFPLSKKNRQLKNNTEFVSWEKAIQELDLPNDTKL